MADGIDSAQLIYNERLKVIGSTLGRLGSVVLAAGVAKLYVDKAFSWDLLWAVSGAGLCWWGGWLFLGLMRKES